MRGLQNLYNTDKNADRHPTFVALFATYLVKK